MTAETVVIGADLNNRTSISAGEAGIELYSGWELIRIGLRQNDYSLIRLGIKKIVTFGKWPKDVVISQVRKMIESNDV